MGEQRRFKTAEQMEKIYDAIAQTDIRLGNGEPFDKAIQTTIYLEDLTADEQEMVRGYYKGGRNR